MRASVVIPVYGPERFLTACLAALAANTTDYELVLVDNGTGFEFPSATVVRNPENLGFARACNQGAAAASGDVLVFLNVDTEVQPEWLDELLSGFHDGVGACGARLVYPDGRPQHTGITISLEPHAHGRNRTDEHPTEDVDGVTGACLAIRRDLFLDLDGFDEGYWNGNEDVDLCLKVTQAGYRIRFVAESVVVHHESATGPERWTAVSDNVALLQEKWGSHVVHAG